MKRITLLIAAIVITASCQNAIITPDRTIPDQTAVPEGTTIITAGFDDLSGASAAAANNSGAPATRTSIDGSTGKVSWSAHEQILIFPNRYGQRVTEGQLFTSLNDAPQATAKFEGILPTADFEFDTYGAIYPPQADAFANGDGIAATLPAHQTGIPDTFPDGLNFAFAFSQHHRKMPLTTFRGIFISRLSYIFPTFHEIGPGDDGSPRAQTSFTANAYGDAAASQRYKKSRKSPEKCPYPMNRHPSNPRFQSSSSIAKLSKRLSRYQQ